MMFYFTASAASASALVLCTVPSGWLRGEQIVYSFNSSVFDVLITLWYVPAGTTTASPSCTVCSSFSFKTNFACPFSMRKNWSTCGCTSSPMSSPGRRHITTSCECGPVNSTCRKYVFSVVCFSIGPTYPVIVLVSFMPLEGILLLSCECTAETLISKPAANAAHLDVRNIVLIIEQGPPTALIARSWPLPERPRRQPIHWGLLAVPSNFAVVLKGSYFPIKAADLVFVSRADIWALSSGRNVRAASSA